MKLLFIKFWALKKIQSEIKTNFGELIQNSKIIKLNNFTDKGIEIKVKQLF